MLHFEENLILFVGGFLGLFWALGLFYLRRFDAFIESGIDDEQGARRLRKINLGFTLAYLLPLLPVLILLSVAFANNGEMPFFNNSIQGFLRFLLFFAVPFFASRVTLSVLLARKNLKLQESEAPDDMWLIIKTSVATMMIFSSFEILLIAPVLDQAILGTIFGVAAILGTLFLLRDSGTSVVITNPKMGRELEETPLRAEISAIARAIGLPLKSVRFDPIPDREKIAQTRSRIPFRQRLTQWWVALQAESPTIPLELLQRISPADLTAALAVKYAAFDVRWPKGTWRSFSQRNLLYIIIILAFAFQIAWLILKIPIFWYRPGWQTIGFLLVINVGVLGIACYARNLKFRCLAFLMGIMGYFLIAPNFPSMSEPLPIELYYLIFCSAMILSVITLLGWIAGIRKRVVHVSTYKRAASIWCQADQTEGRTNLLWVEHYARLNRQFLDNIKPEKFQQILYNLDQGAHDFFDEIGRQQCMEIFHKVACEDMDQDGDEDVAPNKTPSTGTPVAEA